MRTKETGGNSYLAWTPEWHKSKWKRAPLTTSKLSVRTQSEEWQLASERLARVVVGGDSKELVAFCRDAAFEGEMRYLKEKVDAVNQLITTQTFFWSSCRP